MTTAFWFADQPGYVKEAETSAQSFKRHNPDCEVVLFGTPQTQPQVWSTVYSLPARRFDNWYQDSIGYFCHALSVLSDSRLLYFDTDTYTLGRLDALIELIGRFDFIGAHAPARETAPSALHVSEAFCELNIGVLGLHNTQQVRAVFGMAESLYARFSSVYGSNDQAPLRDALWLSSNVNIYVMPPEYNCRFGFGGFAAMPVKVLHGRGLDFEDAARVVNYKPGMRAWTGRDLHERV